MDAGMLQTNVATKLQTTKDKQTQMINNYFTGRRRGEMTNVTEKNKHHIVTCWRTSLLRYSDDKQVVKVIWQKAPHGGPIPRLGVIPGGRKLYHWIPGVGFPISVP